jgi:hypothetical protein
MEKPQDSGGKSFPTGSPLERTSEANERMISGKAQFRAVLKVGE